jgi:hypothetical protein
VPVIAPFTRQYHRQSPAALNEMQRSAAVIKKDRPFAPPCKTKVPVIVLGRMAAPFCPRTVCRLTIPFEALAVSPSLTKAKLLPIGSLLICKLATLTEPSMSSALAAACWIVTSSSLRAASNPWTSISDAKCSFGRRANTSRMQLDQDIMQRNVPSTLPDR